MKNNRIPFAIFCLLIMFFVACDAPQQPEFKNFKNLKFNGLKGKKINLTGEAIFNNPNIFGITLTNTDLDVYLDNEKSGHVLQKNSIAVPANSDFSVPVNVDVETKNLLGKALSLLTKKDIKVRLNGYITVKAMDLDIKVPVNYEQPLKY